MPPVALHRRTDSDVITTRSSIDEATRKKARAGLAFSHAMPIPSVGPAHLELFYFDAGGGHRSAATALQQVIAQAYPQWRVTLVNLQDLLRDVDPVLRITGLPSQDLYNVILKRGWTGASTALLRGLQQGIRVLSPLLEQRLRRHWSGHRPDLVVSVIPNFNGVLYRALRRVRPQTPYVTVMTDLADCPPHFWQERQDQYLVCGSPLAMAQAVSRGYTADRLFRVSGMILKPQFYAVPDHGPTRPSLGLDDRAPVALIMFGGYAANSVLQMVRRLRRSHPGLQMIVMCGHNAALKDRLAGFAGLHAVGFTSEVPEYMRLADFFIGKPGPGSISEALHMGLPVIVERNRKTMTQERYNTHWVEKQGVGLVVRGFREIGKAVEKLLQDGRLETYRQNATQLENRALFEVPVILRRILERHRPGTTRWH